MISNHSSTLAGGFLKGISSETDVSDLVVDVGRPERRKRR
jgi:hypothetical protein